MLVRLGFVALVMVAASCGATAPSSVTGTWTGTWTDPGLGNASMTVTLTQSGTALSGTWSVNFPNSNGPVTGSLTGSLNGTSFLGTFTPDNAQACERDLTATVDQKSMTGTWVYGGTCSASINAGSFSLNEQ
jgi:hypothetical protein